jgi:HK97 family phage portal protein
VRFRQPAPTRALIPTEVRAPTAATKSLSYTSPGLAQVSDWPASTAIRWAYYSNVFVYRCVEVLGVDIASLPIRVGVDPDRPDDFNPQAPLARLLAPPPGGPAPGISARRLWRWSVAQRAVIGKFGWEIERGTNDRPIAFWPLPGSMLDAIPSTSGTSYFAAFKYGRMGEQKTLRPRDVFYSWRPGMNDWRQPESVLQAAKLDVSIAVMQDRYDFAFLKHDARPAAVVVHQAFAEREAREEWRERFLSSHEGPDQAGGVAFMEVDAGDGQNVGDLLDVKTIGLSQRDARFIEREQSKIRAITVGFGVPLSRLGDASNRTFSNAGEEMDMYWGSTIPGWTTELADDINTDLVPEMGDDLVVWFDFSGRDEGRRRVFAPPNPVDLEMAGIVSQDEIRRDLGLAPKPDGKGGFREPVAPTPTPASELPTEELPAAAAPPPEPRAIDHEERRIRLWRASDRRVTALQRLWQRQWRTMFRRQRDATLRRLEGKRGRVAAYRAVDPGDVFDQGFWEAETVDFSTGLYEAVFAVGGARVADLFGLAFDLDAPYVEKWVKARANQLAGPVTDTTYEAIKAELAAGAKAGEDVPALARRIREVFAEADRTRSIRIARTEVISAYNGSGLEVAKELGGDVVGGQEWLAARDAKSRPEHAEADGQVVRIGEKFNVGGDDLEYPGDPAGDPANVVNCVIGDTAVECVGLRATTGRWFDGEIVRISLASGDHLTATPNHPVLTDAGWRPVGDLEPGDHCVRGDLVWRLAREPDEQWPPAQIAEIYDLAAVAGKTERVRTAPPDFHGDGSDGEVDVVSIDGSLLTNVKPATDEEIYEFGLAVADCSAAGEGGAFSAEVTIPVGTALCRNREGKPAGLVSVCSQGPAFLGAHLTHADEAGLGGSSGGQVEFSQATLNQGAGDFEISSHAEHAVTLVVAPSEVVKVERLAGRHQVFNLDSGVGWFIGNSIISGNCRCAVGWLTPEEMQGRSAPKPPVRANGHRSLPLGEAQRRLVLVSLGKMQPEEVAS